MTQSRCFLSSSLYSLQPDHPDDPEESWEVRNRRYTWWTDVITASEDSLCLTMSFLFQSGAVRHLCEHLGSQPGRAGLRGRRGSAGVQTGGGRARAGDPAEGLQPQAAGQDTDTHTVLYFRDCLKLF